MEEQQSKELSQLAQSADGILRSPAKSIGRTARLWLHVLVRPSFCDPWSYAWYMNRDAAPESRHIGIANVVVRSDAEKFKTPVERLKHDIDLEPTIIEHRVILPGDTGEALFTRLHGMELGLLPQEVYLGLDGVSYEVTIGELFAWCRFHWWVEPPNEWAELGQATDDVMAMFSALLDGADAH